MPITIVKPDLEAKLSQLGAASGVPTTKRAITIALLQAAVEAARRRRVSIDRIIIDLKAPRPSRSAKSRRPADAPALRLTKPSAT